MCSDALWNHSRDWNFPSTEFEPTAFDSCCFRRLPYDSGILRNPTEWIAEVFYAWDPPLQSLFPFDGIGSLCWEALHVRNRQILQICCSSVRFQNHMLSFLFLGKEMETDSGQGILTRLEFSKVTRDKSNWCNDNRTVSSLMSTVKSSSDGTLADGKLSFSWGNFHWRHGFTLVLYWLL